MIKPCAFVVKLQADFHVRPIRNQLSWYPRHGSTRVDPLIFGGKIISVLTCFENRRVNLQISQRLLGERGSKWRR